VTAGGRGAPRREEWRYRAAGVLGGALLSSLFATCRVRATGEENYQQFWRAGQPVVFVLWHGRLLSGTYHQRGRGLVALISEHRDGEYIARVVQRWGYGTVRGSSTRGGTGALRGLLHNVRSGHSVVVTPDGPQGPRERIKLGALMIAQLSGAPVIPVATGADRSWFFEGGWDRFQVPKPFSRVHILYGEPIHIPRGAREDQLQAFGERVEGALGTLMRTVDGAA
jgi:lysophospholipid acyltransferase (LPLAT)-like uncharacterized protein